MAVKVIQMLHVRGSGLRSQGRTWKSCFEGSVAGNRSVGLLSRVMHADLLRVGITPLTCLPAPNSSCTVRPKPTRDRSSRGPRRRMSESKPQTTPGKIQTNRECPNPTRNVCILRKAIGYNSLSGAGRARRPAARGACRGPFGDTLSGARAIALRLRSDGWGRGQVDQRTELACKGSSQGRALDDCSCFFDPAGGRGLARGDAEPGQQGNRRSSESVRTDNKIPHLLSAGKVSGAQAHGTGPRSCAHFVALAVRGRYGSRNSACHWGPGSFTHPS